jgi:hypothetical protein
MRIGFIALLMLLCSIAPATAQVSIGINLSLYPELVRVPGYPVYYAPQVNSNYFFYDGMYWVYQGDNWYASSWYNGPWGVVRPEAVPLYVLRVPVRYYRQPPVYFRGWRQDAPPHWDEHWGDSWANERRDWNQKDRRAPPPPAPLPGYQRQFSESRYPQAEQQRSIQERYYRYQPRDPVVRQHDEAQRPQGRASSQPPNQGQSKGHEQGGQRGGKHGD